MLVPNLETENVAGQMKSSDLAAAVHQHLVGPHGPADDLVEVIGRLVLAVDLAIPCKRHARAHELDGPALRGGSHRRRTARLHGRSSERTIPDRGLRQHAHHPSVDEPLVAAAPGSENSDKIPPG